MPTVKLIRNGKSKNLTVVPDNYARFVPAGAVDGPFKVTGGLDAFAPGDEVKVEAHCSLWTTAENVISPTNDLKVTWSR
jgi:hypothetical protein